MTLSLDDPILEPIIIRFYMDKVESCDNGDTIININGVINKLTCKQWRYYNDNRTFDYVLSSSEGINELKMEFSRGEYEIKDIEIYEINTDLFKEEQDTIPLDVDFDKTKGDKLFGNINQIEDGYFIFTISYDEGFRIYLDDKLVNYEMVNDGFIGFPITNGKHSIRLEFVAPYSSLGQIVSCASFCSLVLLVIYEKKKRVK